MVMQVLLQNMTEGPVTGAMKRSQVVLASEVHRTTFRSGFPDRFGVYTPNRAPHLGIAWDKRTVKNVRPGAIRFHDSGQAEGFPFPTPPRGLAWIRCEVDDDPWVFWVTWLLNSWFPMNPDRDTPRRHAIVTDLELPVVRAKVHEWDRRGFRQAGGGDMNSLRWSGSKFFPGLFQVANHGLDRAFMSEVAKAERRALQVAEAPETGVGNDMRHKGIVLKWPTP